MYVVELVGLWLWGYEERGVMGDIDLFCSVCCLPDFLKIPDEVVIYSCNLCLLDNTNFINPCQFQLPAHLQNLHATMETVFLSPTSVTIMMTAKTTVMNLDVVRLCDVEVGCDVECAGCGVACLV